MGERWYDNEAKTLDIWLFNDTKVTGNEKASSIKLKSHVSTAEIGVPPEDYADMLAFFSVTSKPRRKRTRKTPKKNDDSAASCAAEIAATPSAPPSTRPPSRSPNLQSR